MQPKLATLTAMERAAGVARRLRLGSSRSTPPLATLFAAGYAVEWLDEGATRTAPLSEPWTGDDVDLRRLRT